MLWLYFVCLWVYETIWIVLFIVFYVNINPLMHVTDSSIISLSCCFIINTLDSWYGNIWFVDICTSLPFVILMLSEILSNFGCNVGFSLKLVVHLSFATFDTDYGKFWLASLMFFFFIICNKFECLQFLLMNLAFCTNSIFLIRHSIRKLVHILLYFLMVPKITFRNLYGYQWY